jgi:hypothetical protein
MTPDRLARGIRIYHSVYDFADATGYDPGTLKRLCRKWKMGIGKWYFPEKHTHRFRSSLTYDTYHEGYIYETEPMPEEAKQRIKASRQKFLP